MISKHVLSVEFLLLWKKSMVFTMEPSVVAVAKHFFGESTRTRKRSNTNAKEVKRKICSFNVLANQLKNIPKLLCFGIQQLMIKINYYKVSSL
jgi:hypothetical protein